MEELTNQLNLTDAYRALHSTKASYTLFSDPYKTFLKTDYNLAKNREKVQITIITNKVIITKNFFRT